MLFKNLIEKLYLSMDGNLVYYDETTKCHSRYYYDNIVKDKYNDRLCYVVYVDINGLKEVNDKYGHHYGTQLIKQVASNLLSIKGAKDICRIGGDEFILFGDEDFDISQMDRISDISYGTHLKYANEDVVSACKKADSKMYIMKQQVKSKEII